jgi:hypothetical protein
MIRRTMQLIRPSKQTLNSTQELIAECWEGKKAEKPPAHEISRKARDRAA